MWASCLATVRPREARGTASKPFLGMAVTSLRLMALLTRQVCRTCSSKERSFMATPVVHCREKSDRREEFSTQSRRGQTQRGHRVADCGLFAGEALEISHLGLHFLAGGAGGGADALDAQLEFVGVGSARQSLVDGDQLLGVQIEERLVEGLHAV